jgi:hypothetical protein
MPGAWKKGLPKRKRGSAAITLADSRSADLRAEESQRRALDESTLLAQAFSCCE